MPIVPEPRKISKYDLRKLVRVIEAKRMSYYGTQGYLPLETRKEYIALMEYLKHLSIKYEINYDTHMINGDGTITNIPRRKS